MLWNADLNLSSQMQMSAENLHKFIKNLHEIFIIETEKTVLQERKTAILRKYKIL